MEHVVEEETPVCFPPPVVPPERLLSRGDVSAADTATPSLRNSAANDLFGPNVPVSIPCSPNTIILKGEWAETCNTKAVLISVDSELPASSESARPTSSKKSRSGSSSSKASSSKSTSKDSSSADERVRELERENEDLRQQLQEATMKHVLTGSKFSMVGTTYDP